MASPAGKDSVEYKVVRNKYSSIVKGAQHVLPMLANELFSKELIGGLEHGNAMSGNQSAYERTSNLIGSVLTKIEDNTSYYSKFLLALRECDLGDIADGLKSAQIELQSPSGSAVGAAQTAGSRTELKRTHYSELIQQLMEVKYDWENIAINLGFKPNEIEDIRRSTRRANDGNYLFDVIEFWLRWAPPDGRGSKDVATLEALQDALKKANHGRIVVTINKS